MADFTLEALHAEIVNDPTGVGYKEADGVTWKGDQVIADLLNDPANGDVIERSRVSPRELVEQIDVGEYEGLSAGRQRWLDLVLEGAAEVSTVAGDNAVRAGILSCFGQGTTTRTSMLAVVQRQGSRAEVLWGEGTAIAASQVGHAANV